MEHKIVPRCRFFVQGKRGSVVEWRSHDQQAIDADRLVVIGRYVELDVTTKARIVKRDDGVDFGRETDAS